MTLLELCDELNATLIIKRILRKNKIIYSVNIQHTFIYPMMWLPIKYPLEKALIFHKDVNKALYKLCKKVSYGFVKCGTKNVNTFTVKKGNLSILGVW